MQLPFKPGTAVVFLAVVACHILIISSFVLARNPSPVTLQPPVLAASIIQVNTSKAMPKTTTEPEPKPIDMLSEPAPEKPPIPVKKPTPIVEPKERPEVKPEAKPEPKSEVSQEPLQEAPTEPAEAVVHKPAEAVVHKTAEAVVHKTAEALDPQPSAQKQVVATQVDARSQQKNPPVYPRLSKRLNEEGTVILKLLVSETGSVEEITIEQSSGFSRLDNAAIKAAKKWRYIPASINGVALAQPYLMPIEFKLQ